MNAPTPKRRWTPDDDSRLTALRREGHRWPVIGKALGRTPAAAASRWVALHGRRTTDDDKPERHRQPWTPEEDNRLLALWGTTSKAAIATALERSRESINERMVVLLGTAHHRGYTVTQLARDSGWSKGDVFAAIEVLGIKVTRTSNRRGARFMLTEDQCRRVTDWLASRCSIPDVAREEGIGYTTAWRVAQEIGVRSMGDKAGRMKHTLSPKDERQLRQAIRDRYAVSEGRPARRKMCCPTPAC